MPRQVDAALQVRSGEKGSVYDEKYPAAAGVVVGGGAARENDLEAVIPSLKGLGIEESWRKDGVQIDLCLREREDSPCLLVEQPSPRRL